MYGHVDVAFFSLFRLFNSLEFDIDKECYAALTHLAISNGANNPEKPQGELFDRWYFHYRTLQKRIQDGLAKKSDLQQLKKMQNKANRLGEWDELNNEGKFWDEFQDGFAKFGMIWTDNWRGIFALRAFQMQVLKVVPDNAEQHLDKFLKTKGEDKKEEVDQESSNERKNASEIADMKKLIKKLQKTVSEQGLMIKELRTEVEELKKPKISEGRKRSQKRK